MAFCTENFLGKADVAEETAQAARLRCASSSQASILNWGFRGGGRNRRLFLNACSRRVLTIVFHLLRFRMLGMMNLVTMRRARMNTMFLHALVGRFSDLIGGHRLRGRRIGRAGDAGCECRRGQQGGRK